MSKTLGFEQIVLWIWHPQRVLFIYWQHIYVWWMCFFPKPIGISISYNGGSLLGLLLYSYETNLVQWVLIFTFRYLNDIISLNNSNLDDGVNTIYPIEFEIKHTTGLLHLFKHLYWACSWVTRRELLVSYELIIIAEHITFSRTLGFVTFNIYNGMSWALSSML